MTGEGTTDREVAITRAEDEARADVGADRIRAENDRVRTTGLGGQVVYSRALVGFCGSIGRIYQVRRLVAQFNTFTEENDPWHEHDCGTIEFDGETILWKIDDLGPDFRDQGATHRRVLTIMLGSDY